MAIKDTGKYEKDLDLDYVKVSETVRVCTKEDCGGCRDIKPDDKVLITAVDLYRAARELDMEIPDVVQKYCDMFPGEESMLPLLQLRDHLDGSCMMLKKGRCILGSSKPVTCAVEPLGRLLMFHEDEGRQKFHYYRKEFAAADGAEVSEMPVSGWLSLSDVEAYDECVILYKRIGALGSRIMHQMQTDADRQTMFMNIFFMMYVQYDYKEELKPQLEANLAMLESLTTGPGGGNSFRMN